MGSTEGGGRANNHRPNHVSFALGWASALTGVTITREIRGGMESVEDHRKRIGIYIGVSIGILLIMFIVYWVCIFSYMGLSTCYRYLREFFCQMVLRTRL